MDYWGATPSMFAYCSPNCGASDGFNTAALISHSSQGLSTAKPTGVKSLTFRDTIRKFMLNRRCCEQPVND
jgi:hypothetical protein